MGFLPLNKRSRKEKLEQIKEENKTIIIYEAPHKIINTLNDLQEIIGDRKIVLARELTKIYEEFIRGTILEVLEKYKETKGEHIIIIEGNNIKSEKNNDLLQFMNVNELYKYYENKGLNKNEIIKQIAKDKKVSKNDIYKLFVKEWLQISMF